MFSGATRPSVETLLFNFGLGLGVLLASSAHKLEMERVSRLLDLTQADLDTLKSELAKEKSPTRANRSDSAATVRYVLHVLASFSRVQL